MISIHRYAVFVLNRAQWFSATLASQAGSGSPSLPPPAPVPRTQRRRRPALSALLNAKCCSGFGSCLPALHRDTGRLPRSAPSISGPKRPQSHLQHHLPAPQQKVGSTTPTKPALHGITKTPQFTQLRRELKGPFGAGHCAQKQPEPARQPVPDDRHPHRFGSAAPQGQRPRPAAGSAGPTAGSGSARRRHGR